MPVGTDNDKLNRIVKITGIAPTDSFAYDAENKRVYKNEQGVVRNNIYDIYGNLIAEANLGPWAIDYIWANGEPRARVDSPETEGFAPLAPQVEAYWWYHTDHLGTPYVLTDKNKVVVWKISLDPFGETVTETAPLTLDNLRFPGQYFDRGSGLDYNWHRFYQPKVGRYYQPDPILSQNLLNDWRNSATWLTGPNNLYSYVNNNPVNFMDPSGLLTEVIIWQRVPFGQGPWQSHWGHVSVNINGMTYSFNLKGMNAVSTTAYLNFEQSWRAGTGYVLNISPYQEAVLEAFLKTYRSPFGPYFSLYGLMPRYEGFNSCVNPVASGLETFGYDMGAILLPETLRKKIDDFGLTIKKNEYPITV